MLPDGRRRAAGRLDSSGARRGSGLLFGAAVGFHREGVYGFHIEAGRERGVGGDRVVERLWFQK